MSSIHWLRSPAVLVIEGPCFPFGVLAFPSLPFTHALQYPPVKTITQAQTYIHGPPISSQTQHAPWQSATGVTSFPQPAHTHPVGFGATIAGRPAGNTNGNLHNSYSGNNSIVAPSVPQPTLDSGVQPHVQSLPTPLMGQFTVQALDSIPSTPTTPSNVPCTPPRGNGLGDRQQSGYGNGTNISNGVSTPQHQQHGSQPFSTPPPISNFPPGSPTSPLVPYTQLPPLSGSPLHYPTVCPPVEELVAQITEGAARTALRTMANNVLHKRSNPAYQSINTAMPKFRHVFRGCWSSAMLLLDMMGYTLHDKEHEGARHLDMSAIDEDAVQRIISTIDDAVRLQQAGRSVGIAM